MSEPARKIDISEMVEGDVWQRLRSVANAAQSWEVVPRPSEGFVLSSRIRQAGRALKELERKLTRYFVTPSGNDSDRPLDCYAMLELRTSHRAMRSALAAVSGRPRELARLPRVVRESWPEEPRMMTLARAYLLAVDGVFTEQTYSTFVRQLQEHEPLCLNELWESSALLRFMLLELTLDEARDLLRSSERASSEVLVTHLRSLRSVANADWVQLIEPLIVFDSLLRQDPAGAYEHMDFESRQLYRRRIALVAHRSDHTEVEATQAALDLARESAQIPARDPRMRSRRAHVGYYLVDKGFLQLAERVGFHPSPAWRARAFTRAHADDLFLGSIQLLSILFIAAALFPVLPVISGFAVLVTTLILLLLPGTQCAVELVNNTITAFFEPEPLPKLDFSNGIPSDCTTLVAVPVLLLNEKQVRELVTDLEIRFLANRDANLHFALISDLPDSVSRPRDHDSHPLVELAIRLIDELNTKYQPQKKGVFMLLHRHRIYNRRQGVWMGWERKRGKLVDLNRFLAGEFDAFPIKAGRVEMLQQVRYVLTLDSDTQLPHGAAARLAGAMAHPLNQAVIDPKLRIITAGYGILQPRIGVTVSSAMRSRLAAIYSGQSGFDIYTRAVSDAYQDLFGEGSFTGKGIYEASILHSVLNRRFPRNALLSHDLIEGAYARAGLVSDIELIDDYPSHYSAYSRRKHRWIRGDWQISRWIFGRVSDESGQCVNNPISSISRWKIVDNLRRSLVDPFMFILFVAGWLGLPGGPLYWTIVSLLLLIFPSVAQFAIALVRAMLSRQKGRVGQACSALGHSLAVDLMRLIFLPHEMLMTFDAIVRSLVRLVITGERLLEWETAYQTEQQRARKTPIDSYLALTPFLTIGLGVAVWIFAPHRDAIACALPFLLLWASASPVTLWLNLSPHERPQIDPADRKFLTAHALRIWRYFQVFGEERHNYLIPDNVEEEGAREAPRVSPTNIGILLNARQAACKLGFLTVPEFVRLTSASLSTITRLEKFRGHLYNWYDTQTLQALSNPFISTADSGNLVASLYTLRAAAADFAVTPLLQLQAFNSLRAFWYVLPDRKHLPAALLRLPLPSHSAKIDDWIAWLPDAAAALAEADGANRIEHNAWWISEMRRRVEAILRLLGDYLPWALPEYAPLQAVAQHALDRRADKFAINDALSFAKALESRLIRSGDTLANNAVLRELADSLSARLSTAMQNLHTLSANLSAVEHDATRLADETMFGFLVNEERQVLSIGYEIEKHQIHPSCYDLLASEARIATFLAIARGELRQQGWFEMSRDHVCAYGQSVLLSWTGTMFEYLMPALWMRSYSGTLIARTQASCVRVQRAYAEALGIPWGVSESGDSQRNDNMNYHYMAYGIPQLAISPDATAGPVISPYSSFLALAVDAPEALRNLRRMASAGWVGPYGFYEAADYTRSSHKPVLVREWMAHHQGMSLLAITNLLCNNTVQRWFHDNPLIQSSELLLHEIPAESSALKTWPNKIAPRRAISNLVDGPAGVGSTCD